LPTGAIPITARLSAAYSTICQVSVLNAPDGTPEAERAVTDGQHRRPHPPSLEIAVAVTCPTCDEPILLSELLEQLP